MVQDEAMRVSPRRRGRVLNRRIWFLMPCHDSVKSGGKSQLPRGKTQQCLRCFAMGLRRPGGDGVRRGAGDVPDQGRPWGRRVFDASPEEIEFEASLEPMGFGSALQAMEFETATEA